MSDFWYRLTRGRYSIRIALAKLDFNIHTISDCICFRNVSYVVDLSRVTKRRARSLIFPSLPEPLLPQ